MTIGSLTSLASLGWGFYFSLAPSAFTHGTVSQPVLARKDRIQPVTCRGAASNDLAAFGAFDLWNHFALPFAAARMARR